MKNNWEIKKLGDVCDFQNGFAFKSSDYVDSGFFVMRIGNVQDGYISLSDPKYIRKSYKAFDKFILQSGDILISLTGNVGRVGVINEEHLPAVVNQRVARIILKDKNLVQKKFLLYFLSSSYFTEKLTEAGHGAAQQNISTKDIQNLEIFIPTLSEQKHIISFLDKAFANIDKIKNNAEKNLQNSKELFESYLQSIFENPGKDWEEKKLGDICDFVRGPFGGSLKKSIFKKEGYVVYEQQHAIYNQFTEVRYFIDEKKFNEMKRFKLKPGDLIMSCSGTMGKIAIAPDDIKQGIINQALLKLSPHDNLHKEFLKYWMESRTFQDDLKIYTKGAAIKNVVSVKILKEIKMLVPKIQEQRTIVKKINALFLETRRLEAIYQKKLLNIEELKKSILKRAFNGDL
ncbi:MAG: restriction endonuclease subunit S [Candidatus Shapirobacteria bacterium]|nr:restriction endonuclease subunit S [Candidatus Shapirobacteria bacterium]